MPARRRFTEDEEPEERISFLKEQQWSLESDAGAERERRALRVSRKYAQEAGAMFRSCPCPGESPSSPIPVIGALVTRGQEVASLVPFTPAPGDKPSLEYAISEAATALEQARRDRERTERLLKADAIPAKRLDEARAADATAVARVTASKERLTQYESSRQADAGGPQFLARPTSGVVAEVRSPGANVRRAIHCFGLSRSMKSTSSPTSRSPMRTGLRSSQEPRLKRRARTLRFRPAAWFPEAASSILNRGP
jgi:hypothetical protein